MCNPLFAALLGLAAGCGVPPAPADLLAPADPRRAAVFRPPPSPTAGLKRYAPVEARADWGGAAAAPPKAGSPSGEGMGGIDMKGMPGMHGR